MDAIFITSVSRLLKNNDIISSPKNVSNKNKTRSTAELKKGVNQKLEQPLDAYEKVIWEQARAVSLQPTGKVLQVTGLSARQEGHIPLLK